MRTHRSNARARPLIGTLLALVLVASVGCSGDAPDQSSKPPPSSGGSGAGKEGDGAGGRERPPVRAPEPRQELDEAVSDFASAVRADDCERVKALSLTGLKSTTGEKCTRLLAQFEDFDPGEPEQYDTAGAVDFATPKRAGTLVFLTNAAGDFKWALRVPRKDDEEVAGTKAPGGDLFDTAAETATEALRSGDCGELASAARGILPRPELPARLCEQRKGLRRSLEADARAEPERLGANARLGFYSLLPQPKGPYVTLILTREGERAALIRDFSVVPERPGGRRPKPEREK